MFAAAITGGLGLAQICFREMTADVTPECFEARPLEYLDHEIAAGLQMRASEVQCKLGEPDAARLIDDVDPRKVGGHVGDHKINRRAGERLFDQEDRKSTRLNSS